MAEREKNQPLAIAAFISDRFHHHRLKKYNKRSDSFIMSNIVQKRLHQQVKAVMDKLDPFPHYQTQTQQCRKYRNRKQGK